MSDKRFEVQRPIAADPAAIFAVVSDPKGHVAIDSSGMLMWSTDPPVTGLGETFVIHMDREALNDFPEMGRYEAEVKIVAFDRDAEISWQVLNNYDPPMIYFYGYRLEPIDGGTMVTSYYDWSGLDPFWIEVGIFPIIPEASLRATLGILARAVAPRGFPDQS